MDNVDFVTNNRPFQRYIPSCYGHYQRYIPSFYFMDNDEISDKDEASFDNLPFMDDVTLDVVNHVAQF